MKILVTGANGFIGRRLSSRLIAHGHEVYGLSQNPQEPTLLFKKHYIQDISSPFLMKEHFDIVIHLAAYNITNIGRKDTDLYTAINVEGTRNLIQAVRTQKFIYLSTSKVYRNEGLALMEDSPLWPQSAYEQSKLKAEEICRTSFEKESMVVLRSVNVLGWGQASKAILPVFFEKARLGQDLEILASPQTSMQFVYVEDLIDAIEAVIGLKKAEGIFNIANKECVSLEELARMIIAITGSSSKINFLKSDTTALFSPVVSDKAYQHLGWKAKTGIKEIVGFYIKKII